MVFVIWSIRSSKAGCFNNREDCGLKWGLQMHCDLSESGSSGSHSATFGVVQKLLHGK